MADTRPATIDKAVEAFFAAPEYRALLAERLQMWLSDGGDYRNYEYAAEQVVDDLPLIVQMLVRGDDPGGVLGRLKEGTNGVRHGS